MRWCIWPALFGEPQPPAPEPEPQPPAPEPEPEPPAPPAPPLPPLESLGYSLKGLVRANDVVWAMISHPTGDRVLRVGDTLQDDLIVTRIDETGIWVGNGQAEPQQLDFSN